MIMLHTCFQLSRLIGPKLYEQVPGLIDGHLLTVSYNLLHLFIIISVIISP